MLTYRRADNTIVFSVDDDGKIVALGMDATATGVESVGAVKARASDISIEELGRGLVLKSENGHRQRIKVSNLSVVSAVDLDAV